MADEPKFAETRNRVRVYRLRDQKTAGFSSFTEPAKADDPADVLRDLATRIETLQKAERPVEVSVEDDLLVLSTRIRTPALPMLVTVAPPPAKPGKQPTQRR